MLRVVNPHFLIFSCDTPTLFASTGTVKYIHKEQALCLRKVDQQTVSFTKTGTDYLRNDTLTYATLKRGKSGEPIAHATPA